MIPLREQLTRPGAFVVAAELVTSRGLITADSSRRVLEVARELAADPRVDVLSITDNPGGHAMLAPDTLGTDLISRGQEVVIHLSCKDWNRNALESRGWKLGSEGFDNVLALSGDYPVTGHKGLAAPVFDIDSVGLLSLYSDLNNGIPDERKPDTRLDKTNFFLGCVVTNHKRREREVMPQYFKLRKKVEAGARFVINQIGWNTRKDDELLRWIRREQLPVSVLANVYLVSPTAARAFHQGKIPGVVVTDELLALVERHAASPDKGRAFFVDLAARHVAVARGLGFAGVYLGGHMPASTFGEILDLAGSFGSDDWRAFAPELQYPAPDEFYFFEPDPETRLSSDEVNAAYLDSKRRRQTELRVPIKYRFSRRLHDAVFEPGAPLFPAGRAFYRAVEKSAPAQKVMHAAEQAAKVPLFGCRDCGDCSLPEIAYVCPESQCAKNQRNGPCGGTREGLCEVYDTECSGRRRTSGSRRTARRSRCSTARSSSRTTRSRRRAPGRTPSSAVTTSAGKSSHNIRLPDIVGHSNTKEGAVLYADRWTTVRVEVDDGIAWVELNRPEKRNAMSPTLNAEMVEVLEALDADDACGVLVLTGAGEAFSAGMDLKEYFREVDKAPEHVQRKVRRDAAFWQWRLLRTYAKPTIAMVNGWCFGGAFTPLVACDLAIAADEATFGLSEINWGIPPGSVVSKALADTVGSRAGLLYVMTGRTFDGREAAAMGLVNASVPRAELRAEVESLARELLTKNPVVLRAAKLGYKHCAAMSWGQAEDYLYAKLEQSQFLDAERGREQGLEQFLDEKRIRPGLQTYEREAAS